MFEECVIATIWDVVGYIIPLLIVNVAFNIMTQTRQLPQHYFNLISVVLGLSLMLKVLELPTFYIFWTVFVIIYFCIRITHWPALKNIFNYPEKINKAIIIALMVFFEYSLHDVSTWQQSRGVVMIEMIKLYSLVSIYAQNETPVPSILSCLGYICCPATLLLGPWVDYNSYIKLNIQPCRKNFYWLIRIITCSVSALFYVLFSNCIESIIPGNDLPLWSAAYIGALCYRTSHYFICYMSELTMIAAGFNGSNDENWKFVVVNPFAIEFPNSLSAVAVNWNFCLHKFLKIHVYQPMLQYGKFCAIVSTFVASASFHGFDPRITIILLSLSFLIYIETIFRKLLSDVFNICINVRRCTECTHRIKRSSFIAKFILSCFFVLNVINLTYLGVIMEIKTPDFNQYFVCWRLLHYVGHVSGAVMIVLYSIIYLVKKLY